MFGGLGKPLIATILSFGLELPLSIGGVAVYILLMHGNLLGVYWWQAISGGIEAIIVFVLISRVNWHQCSVEAQQRQERGAPAPSNTGSENEDEDNARSPLLSSEHEDEEIGETYGDDTVAE